MAAASAPPKPRLGHGSIAGHGSRRDAAGRFTEAVGSDHDRFWGVVRDGRDGCVEWMAGKTGHGYGAFYPIGRPQIGAHVWAWVEANGPVPYGLTIDHICRNRACVNHAHMEPVPNGDNVLRGTCPAAENARKTHCIRGHALSGHNLVVVRNARNPERPPWRSCRECTNQRKRARRG